MTTTFILNINSRGSVKATSKRVSLKPDEVAISVRLSLPDALFERPQLKAVLTVPDDKVFPHQIDVEVVDDIRQVIAGMTGMDINIVLEGDTPEPEASEEEGG